MKKTLILIGLLLINPTIALANDWEKIDEGTETITKENYEKFVQELEERVNHLNEEAQKQDVLVEYRYNIVSKEYHKLNEQEKTKETINVETCFSSEEMANTYFNSIKLNFNQRALYKEVIYKEIENILAETLYGKCADETCSDEIKALYRLYSNVITNIKENTVSETHKGIEKLTLEQAQELKENLIQAGINATIRKGEPITSQTESISIESKLEKNLFNTKQEAENVIKKLEEEDYIMENAKIEQKTVPGTGTVTSGTKIDASKTIYRFNESSNYVIIKQASNGLVVWTESPLSTEAQQEFSNSYKELCLKNSIDGKNNCSLPILRFISSYDTFDLSDLGNGWKTNYTFTKDNNIIVLTVPTGAVSHTIDGIADVNLTMYYITGNMYKLITTYNYYVDYATTHNEYSLYYNIKEQTPCYLLKYDLVTYEYDEYVDANWNIEKIEYGVGTDNPPHTGIENHIPYINYLFLIAIIVLKKIIL